MSPAGVNKTNVGDREYFGVSTPSRLLFTITLLQPSGYCEKKNCYDATEWDSATTPNAKISDANQNAKGNRYFNTGHLPFSFLKVRE